MRCLDWKKILYLNRIFFPDSLLVIIEVLFFKDYFNLNFLQFTTITSATVILAMFFEIPSGIISDKFGRKKMLIIGNIIDILGVVILLLIPLIIEKKLFFYVLGIELIRVFGRSLASGNFEVLIYQLAQLEEKDNNSDVEFKEISAKSFSIGSIIAAIASFMSTILYNLNPITPIVIDTIFKLVKLFTYFNIPSLLNKEHNNDNNNLKIKPTNKFEVINAIIVIIIFALIFSVSRATFSLYQPIMEELKIPLSYYGGLVFTINIVLFFIYHSNKKEVSILKNDKAIIIVCVVLFFQIPIIFTKSIDTMILKFLCIFIFFSIMQIIRLISEGLSNYFINESLKNIENKTFFFSIYHTIVSLMLVISFQFMGLLEFYIKDFAITYILYCILILIFILFFYYIKRRYLLNEKTY